MESQPRTDQQCDQTDEHEQQVPIFDEHAGQAAQKQPLVAVPSLRLALPTATISVQPISTPPGRCPGRRQQWSKPRNTQAALEEEVERKLQQLHALATQNQQLRTRCHVLEELVQCGTEISRHLSDHGCGQSSNMTRQHSEYCKELELLLYGMPADAQSAPTHHRPLFDGVDIAAVRAASAEELRCKWLDLVKEAALDLQHLHSADMQRRLEEHSHALLRLGVASLVWNPAASWQIAGMNLLTGGAASIPPGHAERVVLSTQWDPEVVNCIMANNAMQTQHQAQLEQETAQLSARLAAATAAMDRATEEEVALQLRTLMARKTVVLAMHAAAGGRIMPPAVFAHVCVQSVPFTPLALSVPRTIECLLESGQLQLTGNGT